MGEVSGREEKFRQALLNEVKGSLFEYLVAQELAGAAGALGDFLTSIPDHYQQVLEQQERLLREADAGLALLLPRWARQAAEAFRSSAVLPIEQVRLTGQLSTTAQGQELGSCDVLLKGGAGDTRLSLKLNKARAAVNTKSGGVKSFFGQYFTHASAAREQERFSAAVEREHALVRRELFALEDLPEEAPDWGPWRERGLTELPGELRPEARELLHAYYARLARALDDSLATLAAEDAGRFTQALALLAGLAPQQVQLICFHEYPARDDLDVRVTSYRQGLAQLSQWQRLPATDSASVEFAIGAWRLAIRVKPMNTFTTTAIKMNCSVRYETRATRSR